jgi:ribosomal protein S18 acetylase RimI-like enzyme
MARRIRRARLRDLGAIKQLLDATYRERVAALGLETYHERMAASLWWYILNRRIWVLDDDGPLIGTIGLQDDTLNLYLFAVTIWPAMQGRGLGRMLIDFAEAQARQRGLRRLQLETPEGFVDAIAFYQRLGFVEVRRQDIGYRSVVMLKRWDTTAPLPGEASARRQ